MYLRHYNTRVNSTQKKTATIQKTLEMLSTERARTRMDHASFQPIAASFRETGKGAHNDFSRPFGTLVRLSTTGPYGRGMMSVVMVNAESPLINGLSANFDQRSNPGCFVFRPLSFLQ